ncbi:MAG: methyltransferase domain-containing protein [Lachnospiraceae bacterium]|nr:methyltransferase domain-containing protein [Lachnospiraceae bacterium]
MTAYEGFARVYDSLMEDVPYERWASEICDTLRRDGIEGGLVLDLCCGTGTMTELMAERGYDMTGVDASADMLEIAAEKKAVSGSDILYLRQDMRSFELYGTMAAIICICDSINYLTDYEDLVACLKLVNNYLDPGGLFIFDFNPPEKYEALGDSSICDSAEDISFIWENSWDPGNRINECALAIFICGDDGRYDRFDELHLQRGYSLDEIKSALSEAGLGFVESRCEEDGRTFVTARECTKSKAL